MIIQASISSWKKVKTEELLSSLTQISQKHTSLSLVLVIARNESNAYTIKKEKRRK